MLIQYKSAVRTKADELFNDALIHASYISPTKLLTEAPAKSIPAGNLTMGNYEDGPKHHFTEQSLQQFLGGADVSFACNNPNMSNFDVLESYLKTAMESVRMLANGRTWLFEEYKSDIMRKLDYCDGQLSTEVELQYVVIDPLIDLFCKCFGLQVRILTLWIVLYKDLNENVSTGEARGNCIHGNKRSKWWGSTGYQTTRSIYPHKDTEIKGICNY